MPESGTKAIWKRKRLEEVNDHLKFELNVADHGSSRLPRGAAPSSSRTTGKMTRKDSTSQSISKSEIEDSDEGWDGDGLSRRPRAGVAIEPAL